MGPSEDSDVRGKPFELSGAITKWHAMTRTLSVDGLELVLAAHIPTVGLEPGLRVVVTGYRAVRTGRMVITQLHLG